MINQLSFAMNYFSEQSPDEYSEKISIVLQINGKMETICLYKNELLMEDLYHESTSLMESIKQAENLISIHLPRMLTLDIVLSLYLLQKALICRERSASAIFSLFTTILKADPESAPVVNFHTLFLALQEKDTNEAVIQKMFTLLDMLDFNQEETGREMSVREQERKIMDADFLATEIMQIKQDYAVYCREGRDVFSRKSNSFLVLLTDGTTETVKGRIDEKEPESKFENYWLKHDGFSFTIEMRKKETGCQFEITRLDKRIDFDRLFRSLMFFENYKEGDRKNWEKRKDTILCLHSKLEKADMLTVVHNYTDPWIKKQQVKYVFPFHFNYTDFKSIDSGFSKKYFYIDETNKRDDFENTFLPLFNDTFFNNRELPKTQIHSRRFQLNPDCPLSISKQKLTFGKEERERNELNNRDLNVEARLFQYGVGFLTLETTFSPSEEVPLAYVHHIDEMICKQVRKVFNFFLGGDRKLNINSTRRGIVYESMEVDYDTFLTEKKENIVLRTCSANKKTYITDKEELKAELNDKYLSRGDLLFYGFSRSCGVQFMVNDPFSDSSQGLNRLSNNFMEEKFYIFLFAIQQRDIIRQFSDKLVRGSIVKQKLRTRRIRKDFIEYMTQVKLSHISDNNVAARFYGRWRTIFDSESIYLEVSEKLRAIDEYEQAKVSHNFNLLSFIVFPIVAISSLFTMGIFQTDPIHVNLFHVVITTIILLCIFYIFTKKR